MWPVRSAVGNDAALVSNPGQFGMEVQEIRVEGAGCQAQDFRFCQNSSRSNTSLVGIFLSLAAPSVSSVCCWALMLPRNSNVTCRLFVATGLPQSASCLQMAVHAERVLWSGHSAKQAFQSDILGRLCRKCRAVVCGLVPSFAISVGMAHLVCGGDVENWRGGMLRWAGGPLRKCCIAMSSPTYMVLTLAKD